MKPSRFFPRGVRSLRRELHPGQAENALLPKDVCKFVLGTFSLIQPAVAGHE